MSAISENALIRAKGLAAEASELAAAIEACARLAGPRRTPRSQPADPAPLKGQMDLLEACG